MGHWGCIFCCRFIPNFSPIDFEFWISSNFISRIVGQIDAAIVKFYSKIRFIRSTRCAQFINLRRHFVTMSCENQFYSDTKNVRNPRFIQKFIRCRAVVAISVFPTVVKTIFIVIFRLLNLRFDKKLSPFIASDGVCVCYGPFAGSSTEAHRTLFYVKSILFNTQFSKRKLFGSNR